LTIFFKTIYLYPSVSLAIMLDDALFLLLSEFAHDIRLSIGVHLLQDA